MLKYGTLKSILLVIIITLVFPGCSKPAGDALEEEEPQVLEQGYVTRDPEYVVDEDGTVYYTDSRTALDDPDESGINPDLAPPFPGSQHFQPLGDASPDRDSYMTRAPYEAVEQFYRRYLATGLTDPDATSDQPEAIVNSILSKDEDERRQTALFVNQNDGPRGGMKVMLKEFPAQDAVQIILTTLDATPMGLNPTGIYVTPEQVDVWTEEYQQQQDEYQRRREEAEAAAVDPESEDGSEDDGEGDE